MAGTVEGRAKGIKTMKERYTPEQWSEWGRKGGKASAKGGFKDPERAREAARISAEVRRKKKLDAQA